MSLKVITRIDCDAWKKMLPDVKKRIEKAAKSAWKRGNTGELFLPVKNAEVSVLLTDDHAVHSLNKQYRNIDRPTNVLSFAALDDENEPIVDPLLLGDIVVAFQTTLRESEEQNKAFSDHLFHLIVHGMLHLIGYDHMQDSEAEEMERLEMEILAENGMENPYAYEN